MNGRYDGRPSRFLHGSILTKVLIGVVALGAIAFGFFRLGKWQSDQAFDASAAAPMAARVDQVDGDVGIASQFNAQDQPNQPANQTNTDLSNESWAKATVNSPLSVGDRIYVRDGGHASVAFSGRSYAKLESNTLLDVVTLTDNRTQVALRSGSAVFDCGGLQSNEFFEVETPNGAVDFVQPGLYQFTFQDNGDVAVSVLSGEAKVVSASGSTEITKGETMTLTAGSAPAVANQLAPASAGAVVDNYYRYRYPKKYDGRYADYDSYLRDPFYYEPFRQSVSYRYLDDSDYYVAGLDDLDDYGTWEDVEGYGHCWRPTVAVDWAPYQDGYWDTDYPWGYTWVSYENWGWAPYHYGRWTCVHNEWFWVPGSRASLQVYSPALVAFVPITDRQEIGWVPLGPRDQYVPRYYDTNWQAHFQGNQRDVDRIEARNFANFNSPNAMTVVPVANFNRPINRGNIVRTDPAAFARTRPVTDPFAVAGVRQNAVASRGFRDRMQGPPQGQQQFANRPVVASRAPIIPPTARNFAQQMRVQSVGEAQARQRMQVNRNNQPQPMAGQNPAVPPQPNLTPRQVQQDARQAAIQQQRQDKINQLSPQAAAGDKRAATQVQQLQRQQQAAQQRQQVQEQLRAREAARSQQVQQNLQQREAQQQQQQGQRQQQVQQRNAARPQMMQQRQQQVQQQMQQRAQQAAQQRQAVQQQRAAQQHAVQQRPVQRPQPQAQPRPQQPVQRAQPQQRPVQRQQPQAQPRPQQPVQRAQPAQRPAPQPVRHNAPPPNNGAKKKGPGGQ